MTGKGDGTVTTTSADLRLARVAARRLAVALRAGRCPTDATFDRFLPAPLQDLSPRYWTPLAVIKRASEWLDGLDIQSVADIGSGAGKFCVAGALFSRCRFIGLERSPSLVASARRLARLFGVDDRVRFDCGALGETSTPVADAYYFFNPFDDHSWELTDWETSIPRNGGRHLGDVVVAEELLRGAPRGTCVLTYNGFGGRIPESYRLIRIDLAFTGGLRLWRKDNDLRLLSFRKAQ